jgi:hypothetical protein
MALQRSHRLHGHEKSMPLVGKECHAWKRGQNSNFYWPENQKIRTTKAGEGRSEYYGTARCLAKKDSPSTQVFEADGVRFRGNKLPGGISPGVQSLSNVSGFPFWDDIDCNRCTFLR